MCPAAIRFWNPPSLSYRTSIREYVPTYRMSIGAGSGTANRMFSIPFARLRLIRGFEKGRQSPGRGPDFWFQSWWQQEFDFAPCVVLYALEDEIATSVSTRREFDFPIGGFSPVRYACDLIGLKVRPHAVLHEWVRKTRSSRVTSRRNGPSNTKPTKTTPGASTPRGLCACRSGVRPFS